MRDVVRRGREWGGDEQDCLSGTPGMLLQSWQCTYASAPEQSPRSQAVPVARLTGSERPAPSANSKEVGTSTLRKLKWQLLAHVGYQYPK